MLRKLLLVCCFCGAGLLIARYIVPGSTAPTTSTHDTALLATADDVQEIVLEIRNRCFVVDKIYAVSNKPIKLIVHNRDLDVAEFESYDLKREKIVPPESSITINIAPLGAGVYNFFDDFNQDAKGQLIVQEHEIINIPSHDTHQK